MKEFQTEHGGVSIKVDGTNADITLTVDGKPYGGVVIECSDSEVDAAALYDAFEQQQADDFAAAVLGLVSEDDFEIGDEAIEKLIAAEEQE